ncbi:MAG: PAS domain S-box protein [Desulfamplus sp.]|nr:PAS domain S-box protein [Desulfamplus sp.]
MFKRVYHISIYCLLSILISIFGFPFSVPYIYSETSTSFISKPMNSDNIKNSGNTESRNILILHSYHQGYEWTDDVHKGIMENIVNIENFTIFTEYLDAQRNRSDEYLNIMEKVYIEKYKTKGKNITFELIIVSDDHALQFLRARKELFKGVPIVFCGINNFAPANFDGLTNYTGVNERISVKDTVELALKLRPNAKKMAVIAGSSITEQRNLKIFKEEFKLLESEFAQKNIQLEYLIQLEPEEIKTKLKECSEEDIIIYLALFSTPSGKTYTVKESIEFITNNSSAAIFGFWDFVLPFGVIGGKVAHGYSQGQWVARIANRILKGSLVSEIPVQMSSPNKFVFNDEVLQKYNISRETLPPKSIIMNKTAKGLILEWDTIGKKSFFGYDMFERHGNIMLLIDPKTGVIVDANQPAVNCYGYPSLVGMNISNINVLSSEEIKAEMKKAKEQERNYFNFKHRLANKSIIDVEVYSYPVKIGGITLLFSIIHDVTDRVEAERAVKQRDLFIFSTITVALIFQLCLIFYLLKNIKTRKKAEYFLQKSNEELSLVIIEHKKAEEALTKSEKEFREIFNSTNEAIFIHDAATGKIIDCNDRTVEMYGCVDKNTILNKNIGEFSSNIAPYDEATAQQLIKKAINEGSHTFEWIAKKSDGEIFWVEVSLKKTEIGGKDRILAIARDITERKKAEEDREKLQTQLIQSQKMESVGRLAGGVAHDFNNMLGVILGHAEIALEEVYTNRAVYGSLREIRNASQRSADLTRQLLAFARKQTVSPKVLDLNQTVEGMLKMLVRLIGEDIELMWLPSKDLWRVMIDPTQIDQILANLCINAKDAISGAGNIKIETKNITFKKNYGTKNAGFINGYFVGTDHEEWIAGDFVMLTVSDNGCGMDKDTIDNIFEPFFTTKELHKGTGLGLATVYGIVKQNKGFINVYSEPEKGTSFKIYFPRYIEKITENREQNPLHNTEDIERGYETILLVEDEVPLLEMTKIMLQKIGYTVIGAETPQKAIELAIEHKGKIDLLMSDVVMPLINGRELAMKITSLYPNIKCLFMSGYTADVIAHHGVLDKSVNFIQKPFTIKDLALKVKKSIET